MLMRSGTRARIAAELACLRCEARPSRRASFFGCVHLGRLCRGGSLRAVLSDRFHSPNRGARAELDAFRVASVLAALEEGGAAYGDDGRDARLAIADNLGEAEETSFWEEVNHVFCLWSLRPW